MEMPANLNPLTRSDAAEAFAHLDAIEGLIGSMPYRDAKQAIALSVMVREIIEESFPGGYVGGCEACGAPLGADEIAVSDFENGCHFCAACAPSPEEAAAQHIELRDADPGNANLPENGMAPIEEVAAKANGEGVSAEVCRPPVADTEGWIDWPGSTSEQAMPVLIGTLVDIERRSGLQFFNAPAGGAGSPAAETYWINLQNDGDIVRYRLTEQPVAEAPRADGGADIIHKHTQINGGSDGPAD